MFFTGIVDWHLKARCTHLHDERSNDIQRPLNFLFDMVSERWYSCAAECHHSWQFRRLGAKPGCNKQAAHLRTTPRLARDAKTSKSQLALCLHQASKVLRQGRFGTCCMAARPSWWPVSKTPLQGTQVGRTCCLRQSFRKETPGRCFLSLETFSAGSCHAKKTAAETILHGPNPRRPEGRDLALNRSAKPRRPVLLQAAQVFRHLRWQQMCVILEALVCLGV